MAEGTEVQHAGKGVVGFLKGSTAGLPNWAWMLIIGAGIAFAVVVPKFLNKGTGTSEGTGTNPAGGLGLAIDPTTGLPYAVEGLVPNAAVPSTGGGAAPDSTPIVSGGGSWEDDSSNRWQNQQQQISQSQQDSSSLLPSKPTPIPPTLLHATLRSQGSRPEIKTIDKGGIPVRDKPGGKVLRTLPYKSQIVISGQPIQGPKNLGSLGGSTLWYPVSGGGYVSKYDVGNFPTNSPGVVGWP